MGLAIISQAKASPAHVKNTALCPACNRIQPPPAPPANSPSACVVLYTPMAAPLRTPGAYFDTSEGCDATAIQAVNDLVAIGAGSLLLRQGVKIPEHISLAGFGNILVSEHFRVPLTTVRQPIQDIGIALGRALRAVLAGEVPTLPRLELRLVERASVREVRA